MVIIPTEKRFDWNHAPIVLFIVVLINVMIYFGYQFGDDFKQMGSIETYKANDFLKEEWPIFQEYLKKTKQTERLEKNNKLHTTMVAFQKSQENEGNYQTDYDYQEEEEFYEEAAGFQAEFELIYNIVADMDFYEYLEKNAYNLFYLSFIEKWAHIRAEINEEIKSISYLAYGLIPDKMSVVTLFTHQFLHGSVMHLLGNMFFLIICGFAVEAAIGHLKFLAFYLISGLSGGLLFSLLDLSSTTPLVGASGAISGVMAMYLGVFRFKKIEFFYWFFIFVGYFRAPALLILPFYVGKELFQFFNDTGSNVAFMAHAGGFVAGAILMVLAYFFNPKMFNEEYIEEDQDVPKVQKDLANVYDDISKSRFQKALRSLNDVIAENGAKFEWQLLRYHLLTMQNDQGSHQAMIDLFKMNKLKQHELNKLEKIWKEQVSDQTQFANEDLFAFAWNMANGSNYLTAEYLFELLQDRQHKIDELGQLAKKLSFTFGRINNDDKKLHYEKIAVKLL